MKSTPKATKKTAPKKPTQLRTNAASVTHLSRMLASSSPEALQAIATIGERAREHIEATTPPATKAEVAADTIAAILGEAQGHLGTLAYAFASAAGEIESGFFTASDRISRFNVALAEMEASLTAIRGEVATLYCAATEGK